MARYTKTDVVTGDTVKSDVNVQLGLIETAIDDTLSRKGDLPNTMEADLDMNSNQILNLPDAVTSGEPITLGQGLSSLTWTTALSDAKYYDTIAEWKADTTTVATDVVILKDRANGVFDVISGTGTANTYNIVAHDTLSLSIELRDSSPQSAVAWGVPKGSDGTAAAQHCLDNNTHVYFEDGTYLFKDLAPNTGNILECESEETNMTGVVVGDDIITTTGSLLRIKIIGGEWKDCTHAWRHTGNSALAYCVFEKMRARDLTTVFRLSASVGNSWVDPDFGSSAGVAGTANIASHAIHFDRTGSGATNINYISRGTIFNVGGSGVKIDDDANPCNGLHISTWFEECKQGAFNGQCSTTAINNLRISASHMENCGDATYPDIELNGTHRTVSVFNNNFATPTATGETTQTERIKSTGNGSIDVYDNYSKVDADDSTVLISINGSSSFESQIENNFLENTGTSATYKSLLFSQTGTQTIKWSNKVGSGNTTEDEYPTDQYENFSSPELTIASGVITVQGNSLGHYTVDTEADAATDDLDTINGGYNGQLLTFTAASGSRDVVFKDNTGNIQLRSGDITLDTNQKAITLRWIDAVSKWVEL